MSLLLAALIGVLPAAELAGKWLALDSEAMSPPALADAAPARVPGNWYLEGRGQGGVRWYLREVELDGADPRPTLAFEGIDYEALVFWDGVQVGAHRGYFDAFRVEVPRGSGTHLLAVRVDSPEETAQAFSLHKQLIKGVLSHHDTRPGGAWSARGQEANTGGIWGRVWLESGAQGWVESLRVDTLRLGTSSAALVVTAKLGGLEGARKIELRVFDPGGKVVASHVAPASEDGEWRHAFSLPRPELWWPAELGKSPLYTAELTLSGPGGITRQRRTFGIRTIEEDSGRRFLINGQPFFIRGTNYIPSLYLSLVDEKLVRADLELMKAAHINAIRVHAHITSNAFYDQADRLGLLVFQDFPLQWGYDDGPAFTAEAARQAAVMLAQLRHHPSIVHWTGHNEAPWSADWMAQKYPDWSPNQNRALDAAVEAVLQGDTTRPSQANSHTAEHAWAGWYFGTLRDFDKPSAHPLLTEFGAQALPRLETLKDIFPGDALWPLTPERLAEWEYRNFQPRETFENAHVARGERVEDLIANTQAYQSLLLQRATEGLRRQAWQPVTGLFQFMFNEHWPSMSWGIVDYQRRPKPGYAALATAYQPILGMASRRPGAAQLELAIANDTPSAYPGALIRVLVGAANELPRAERVDVLATAVTRLSRRVPLPGKTERVQIELLDAEGRTLSTNTYLPGYFEHD